MERLRENVHALSHLGNQVNHNNHAQERAKRFNTVEIDPWIVCYKVDHR